MDKKLTLGLNQQMSEMILGDDHLPTFNKSNYIDYLISCLRV